MDKLTCELSCELPCELPCEIATAVRTCNTNAFIEEMKRFRKTQKSKRFFALKKLSMIAAAAEGAIAIAQVLTERFKFRPEWASKELFAITIYKKQLDFFEYLLPTYSTNGCPHADKSIKDALEVNAEIAIRVVRMVGASKYTGTRMHFHCVNYIVAHALVGEMEPFANGCHPTAPQKVFHGFLQSAIETNNLRMALHVLGSARTSFCMNPHTNCCLDTLITGSEFAYRYRHDWEDNASEILETAFKLNNCELRREKGPAGNMLNLALRYHQFKIAAKLVDLGVKPVRGNEGCKDATPSVLGAIADGNVDALKMISRLKFDSLLNSDFVLLLGGTSTTKFPLEVKIQMSEQLFCIYHGRAKMDMAYQREESQMINRIARNNDFEFARWLVDTKKFMPMDRFRDPELAPEEFREKVAKYMEAH